MGLTLRSLQAIIKNRNIRNTEVSRDRKRYYVLHICKNNTPVPLFSSIDIKDIEECLTQMEA